MIQELELWTIVWGVLLLPGILFGIARWTSSRNIVHVGGTADPGDALRFGRGLAAISCVLPVLSILLTFTSQRHWGNIGIAVFWWLPILDILAGCSACLLIAYGARGVERWLAPVACVLAMGLTSLMLMGLFSMMA